MALPEGSRLTFLMDVAKVLALSLPELASYLGACALKARRSRARCDSITARHHFSLHSAVQYLTCRGLGANGGWLSIELGLHHRVRMGQRILQRLLLGRRLQAGQGHHVATALAVLGSLAGRGCHQRAVQLKNSACLSAGQLARAYASDVAVQFDTSQARICCNTIPLLDVRLQKA